MDPITQLPGSPSPTPIPAPPGPSVETGAPIAIPAPSGSPASPSRPFGGFFDGITLMDVGMLALVSLTLFYSIYASRQVIADLKTRQDQTAQDISSLKAQVQSIMPAAS